MKPPSLTIGIEEEYQVIDPKTLELKSYITEILQGDKVIMDEIKPELHQSMVEVGSKVCRTPDELRGEIVRLRGMVMDLAARSGLVIAAAGTHPFSLWTEQEITPLERYLGVKADLADLAQQLLIFGTHIHVGIEDKEFLVDVMNVSRYLLPHLLALSTSSPFWQGRDTGLKSFRTTVFRRFPRTGIPDHYNSWSEYEEYLNMLVELHCIDSGKKVWWDLRPHPHFGTLEFRVCDVPTSPRVTVCLAALCQAIVVKLYRLRRSNLGFRTYARALVEENKWRAARYGIDGSLIDFGKRQEVPMRELALELLDFLDDVVDDLGSRSAVEYVRTIIDEGTSADKQLAVFRRTGDLREVVRWLVEETRASNRSAAGGAR